MDWLREALSFPECNITRVRDFASEADMKQAISQYNRAVRNLRNDSMDIAIIALRHLAARYPAFAQAVLLYGCCMVVTGNPRAGLKVFENASVDTFTERYRTQTEEYLSAAQATIGETTQDGESAVAEDVDYSIVPTAPLLQRGNASRRRVRLAGDRERKSAGSAGIQMSGGLRDPLLVRFPFLGNVRKILTGVLALAVLATIVYGLVNLGGALLGKNDPKPPSEREKLEWLVNRLEQSAGEGDAVNRLLNEYREYTGDETAGTTLPASTTVTSAAATTAGPSPIPSATPVPATTQNFTPAIQAAYDVLQDAEGRMGAQPIIALQLLNSLPDILIGVPDATQTAGVPFTASEILEERTALIAANRWHICEAHRVAAIVPWQTQDFETCLLYYEPAYRIDPQYYTGYIAYRLGFCYEQIGAISEALECYGVVEAIGPASPQYAGAMARIQLIK